MKSESAKTIKTGVSQNPEDKISDEFRSVLKGNFVFRDDMKVSNASFFKDDVWTWYDKGNIRLQNYILTCLTLNWKKIKTDFALTNSIISDLKRFVFLQFTFYRHLHQYSSTSRNIHPATIVGKIKALVPFLAHIRKQMSDDDFCLIENLSDIKVEDLREGLSTYQNAQLMNLKSTLKDICNEVIANYFERGKLKWNVNDIETLSWKLKTRQSYSRIPDELFRLLSNSATKDIKQFLEALQIEPIDRTKIGLESNIYLEAYSDFKSLFEQYIKAIVTFRNASCDSEKKIYFAFSRTPIKPLSKLIDRARKAAQVIIAMYTGARLSELNSFEAGCLKFDGEKWVILGMVIKNEDIDKAVKKDDWLAIPIVRDAVNVLEQTARLTESTLLFHPTKSQSHDKVNRRGRSGLMARWFRKYTQLVDVGGKWKHIRIHSHMFRHTLVFQMRKAGLNLPFITYQLKHQYDAMNKTLNNVTLSYGSLGSQATEQAIHAANLECVRQIFHPDSPVAGGGAEEHKLRREAYFQGMALEGIEAEEILDRLAEQGMPLTDVGLGLCQGQKKVVVDGIKTDPPCIGQLRCNPVRCPNGIIPLYKITAWQRIAEENKKRSEDPEFVHARDYHEEAVNEAEAVIDYLSRQKSKSKNEQ